MMKQAMLADPVLVGREHELEELTRHLDSAAQGLGTTVFISGEAGSGKTRLTREFLSIARKRGVAVMAGWCLSDSAAPFFPFVEAFNDYFEPLDAEEQPASLQQPAASFVIGKETQMLSGERGITAWLTGPAPLRTVGRPEVSRQVWKDQVFAGVAKTLHSISLQVPMVLFIEDIHWADSASLALLQYLARSINNSEKILVLATFRGEALTADVEGRSHPLAEALRAMGREDLFAEIKLPNLNQVDVSKIAENMIGGILQPKLAEKLTIESRGNPLFVVESLRMLFERKSLIRENNQWCLTVDELGIPSKVKDIILRRLAILKRPQRRVLEAASVIGEKFDLELLSAVLGLDSLEVLESLTVIAESSSIVCVEGDFYRFDHAKSREVLYVELPLPLKKGYHARIAEKLEDACQSGRLPYSDLAHHFAEAGNKEKAVKYSLSAGQEALAKWSNPEAIKHFSYVLQNISESPENAEARRAAQEGLGDAYYAESMYTEAGNIFEALALLETGKVRLRAYRKALDSLFLMGPREKGPLHMIELINEAEKYAAFDRLESARVLWCKGKAEYASGDSRTSLRDREEALRVFEEEYSLEDVAKGLFGIGVVYASIGGLQEKAIVATLRSAALFLELGDFRGQIEALQMTGGRFFDCGLFEEAKNTSLRVIETLEKLGGQFWQRAAVYGLIGIDFERRELFSEALSQSLKELECAKKTDSNTLQKPIAYSRLLRQYSRLGDVEHAEEYYTKLMNSPPEFLSVPFLFADLSGAVLFAAKNQWVEANQRFKGSFEELSRNGQPTGWAVLFRQHYGWALERQGRFEEARVQLEEIQKLYRQVEERFAHVNLQASLMVRREITVGEGLEMRLDMVNVSRKTGLLVKAEDLIPPEGFKLTALPSWCSLQNGIVEMKNREMGAFKVETVKLFLQAVKAGTFTLNPKAIYIDELGGTKTVNLNPATITVQAAKPAIHVLPGRVSSGFDELDDLLGGGIPENYSVVLASPSNDERSLLIKRFLETGAEASETTLYLTAEAGSAKTLAENYSSDFTVFICNPQADAIIENLPNVNKLKGVENLTEIDIALTKYFRTLNPGRSSQRKVCIQIVSDVLLQHHAVNTRKWLSALLPNLKSKGFTTLAVIDPNMHPTEEAQAIMGLFDGEIRITEKETAYGLVKNLRIRKLTNQRHSENELSITKEKLRK